MAEESVRLANVAVAEALAEVNRCRVSIENIEKNIQNIENRSNFTGDEPGYKNFIDRLDKARADLDKARDNRDKANHRLKEARADLDKARADLKEARADLACARVNELDEEMKKWKRLNPEYLFDERLTAIYKDKDRDLTNARAE